MFKVFAITLRKIENFLQKAKYLSINFGAVRYIFILLALTFISFPASAQEEERPSPDQRTDTLSVSDSLRISRDTLQNDTTTTALATDTLQNQAGGDIETTINYSARDSIRASTDGKKIWLYGDAVITYGEIKLEADEIEIDYANNTLTAHGTRDSLGRRIGYPVFTNGAEVYETKDIVYNFKTRKARITEVVTQQNGGYMAAETVFKNEKNELFTIRNSYTTCDLEDPHYAIRSTRAKAIPDDKIVTGPFYFEFNDIPIPAILPFGMFPAQRESKSGIIFPSYGEERRRGFNLRGGGYFFDISDYIKLAVTGDIYSKGGHALYLNSNYVKRYRHNGSLNFSYSKTRLSDRVESPEAVNDYRLAWSHSPQSKGTGRFSASVNAATSTFNKNNNLAFGYNTGINSTSLNNTTAQMSSSISYSKRFAGTPFSMGINLNHSQNIQTREVDLVLPRFSLTMTNLYPFQRPGGTPGPLDNFTIGYSMTASNNVTNNIGRPVLSANDSIAPFNFDNLPLFLRNARNGIQHSPQIGYSTKFLKYFTLSPSISYQERWYFEKLNWTADTVNNQLVFNSTTAREFNRVANYSFGAGINTRIYGTFFFKKGKVQAIRHIINPNVSYSYTPDFTRNTNYFDVFAFTRPQDTVVTYTYKSKHEGFLYGGAPAGGRSGSISFGVGNNLEMKVQSEGDSVPRKVMLLNNLSINSGYNYLADSFKLANFSISANSSILEDLININVGATLDPYRYESPEGSTTMRRVNTYAWAKGTYPNSKGRSLGRITSANLALSTNFNPQARKKEQQSREKIASSDLPEAEKEFLISNPNAYVDFEIPWSLNVRYNLTYSNRVISPARVTQTLQFSGDLALSEKWKITFNSGYHFETKEFTQTDLRLSRDLHCWVMSFSWIPFGRFTSYFFTINVKSSLLQDLKLERRKPFFDNL